MISKQLVAGLSVLAFGVAARCTAQAPAPAPVTVEPVTAKVLRLAQMANTTVLKTDAGLLVVDSGTPDEAARISAKLAEIGGPVVYLVNTHYHGDHAGGNPVVGKGATIVAHEGVKASLARGLAPGQTLDAVGAPQETYTTERELKVGKESVKLLHFGRGHSSGDTIVVFEAEKVIAAGDLFFNGVAPYIDVADGSDTANWVKTIAAIATRYPGYKVVPGHGPLADIAGWQRFAEYLTAVRVKVAAAIAAGQTREQAVASITLDEFPDVKPMGEFLSKAKNVGWVYDEMKRAS